MKSTLGPARAFTRLSLTLSSVGLPGYSCLTGHLLSKHPTSGQEVWVAVHTKKDAGRLGNRILREAGVE
jgi:hypothetical protein